MKAWLLDLNEDSVSNDDMDLVDGEGVPLSVRSRVHSGRERTTYHSSCILSLDLSILCAILCASLTHRFREPDWREVEGTCSPFLVLILLYLDCLTARMDLPQEGPFSWTGLLL